ncbi:MAG: type I-E CRISPR-associated protein Cas5/CasD [Acidobacteriota bacterium]|nr:type I-E CRISPR-associated protein Cas5/CasD [Acidobacteriota bacterium]NLH69793.1 type I-E CRISPR-associated protein Cas5/CasD [Brooklawnia sp.]
MTVLLLRLAGPMQAWGDDSRFSRRDTRRMPSKSGVLGLLAAADGRRRADPIEDLARLRFGVRVDQPGRLQRDFQTAINWDSGQSMPLSYRYYLADAVFVAGVEGDPSLLEALAERVRKPRFSLYLGRRSCPVTEPVFLGLVDGSLEQALRNHQWQASTWYRRRQPREVPLELYVDAYLEDDRPVETRRDVPISYNPERREYGWREVAHAEPVVVPNPAGVAPTVSGTDWLAAAVTAIEEV